MNNEVEQSQNRLSVILAEDHEAVRDLLGAMLRQDSRLGTVGEVKSGHDALEAASRIRPDILVTDLRLPDIDGIEITKKLGGKLPATKVIIISMYNDDARVYNALAAGARGYVIKSALDKLPEAIIKVAGGDIYLAPPLSLEKIERYRTSYNKPPLPERGESKPE